MRASIKWLKDYVDFQETPEVLAEMLTMAGVPVATLEYPGKGIEGVVTGKLSVVEVHPGADKLSICKVDVGTEILTIVTGANNIRQGDIVPVAKVGAMLPGGLEIQPTDLRGVLSYGMLCSADELNMDAKIVPPELRNGIYILPADTPLGVDVRTVTGLDDVILEFELTANRADCFSILGLAREVAVLTGGVMRKPMLTLRETGSEKAGALAKVSIETPELCPRFACRIFQEVKIGPSPAWMQQRLQAAGMRPISNVVDVTNFVMLEMGQPMHAYDYNLLSRHSIVVRKAYANEPLTTLDDVKRDLNHEMLVIADAAQAVGLAGVMGGLATEISSSTRTVLLEAAAFNGPSIRRTSRELGMRSEASGRFERGVDTANIIQALDRAASLLEEMGACKVCPEIVDCYPGMTVPKQITFTAEQINTYLGTEVPEGTMTDILKRLGFDVNKQAEQITVTAPTWRGDVTGPADISEEIARIYGFDKIPSTTPVSAMERGRQSFTQMVTDRIKTLLTGAGMTEIISFSFGHPQQLDKLSIPQDSRLRRMIEVLNPITDDFPVLRTTLLGGVLDTVVRNLSRKNDDIQIFEIGPVYHPESLPLETWPKEPVMLCGAFCGRRETAGWNQSRESVDFYDAKGNVEVLLAGLGIEGYEVLTDEQPFLHPGKTALLRQGTEELGFVGEVHPQVLASFGINRPVCIFELNVDQLVQHTRLIPQYYSLPKYPAVTRDLAVILPLNVSSAQVEQAIREQGGKLLHKVQLFDVYAGQQVPEGFRSLAFALTYRSAERTLTDEEVDGDHQQMLAYLEKNLNAKLRL
ncbi:MAG TPA: phenylalanine--tRNA ligase subunit beta [Patescibacteria group bacterium]|nr:phenylalanine--tRNA ligase subunit beta [Patescibacteria group bacterium]